MKKILGLSIAALLVMGLVGGGTWAYFSDPETSTGNILSAGTLDLTLNGANANVNIMAGLVNKAPGDSDNTSFATLANAGSVAGELDIATGAATNTESVGATEYEADVIGGAGAGELGANAEIAPWLDLNADGVFDAGSDKALKSDNTVVTTTLQWNTVDNFASKTWNEVISANMTGTPRFYLAWRIPTSANNTIQGDSFTLGFTFTLEQAAVD